MKKVISKFILICLICLPFSLHAGYGFYNYIANRYVTSGLALFFGAVLSNMSEEQEIRTSHYKLDCNKLDEIKKLVHNVDYVHNADARIDQIRSLENEDKKTLQNSPKQHNDFIEKSARDEHAKKGIYYSGYNLKDTLVRQTLLCHIENMKRKINSQQTFSDRISSAYSIAGLGGILAGIYGLVLGS